MIVDEFTGRLMVGRRYSDGLHQAIEAKEGVKVGRESQTCHDNPSELLQDVPQAGRDDGQWPRRRRRNSRRSTDSRSSCPHERRHDPRGQPRRHISDHHGEVRGGCRRDRGGPRRGTPGACGNYFIGALSASASFSRCGNFTTVLNAKHHEREAQIVAQAGHLGAVTWPRTWRARHRHPAGGNPDFLAGGLQGSKNGDSETKRRSTRSFWSSIGSSAALRGKR